MSSYRFVLRPTWTISALWHKSKYKSKFSLNFFLNQIFGFPCYSTREDLSIDVSITNVGLILTKLRWFKLFGTSQNTSQNSISNFFEKIQIFVFPCCSTREEVSIDASITNVGLISTKPGRFLFSGYGQTDWQTHTVFGILIWKHMGTQKISTQSSKLVVSRRSLYASPETEMHNHFPLKKLSVCKNWRGNLAWYTNKECNCK